MFKKVDLFNSPEKSEKCLDEEFLSPGEATSPQNTSSPESSAQDTKRSCWNMNIGKV